jgi:GNAT superfamily N-acetyltransferase
MRFFNRVMALHGEARPRDAIAAVEWIEGRGWPVIVQLSVDGDPEVRDAIDGLGLQAVEWQSPIMVLEPIPRAPRPPAELSIRTGGADLSDDYIAAVPIGPVLARVLGREFASDRDVRLAVGYLENAPVAVATAIRDGSTIGIYAVATAERVRRRGFGRAVTWAAIQAGLDAWGGSMAVLQSSEMGVPVYASMGFTEIGRYIECMRPRA